MKIQSFLMLLLLSLLIGCDSFYPKANFHLINFSKDKPTTDITVKFGGDVIYSGPLHRSTVAPDIQYTFSKRALKGKYNIIIEADGGRIKESHPLMLGKDKWVIIRYSYLKPVDSATLLRVYGFVDSARLTGSGPKITVGVRNEPIKEYY
ncbi:hypothetical protein V9K67_26215 [Paraflavisolibacter sp. H34]|uniref:hypothetical protein n=1 Tax=Huijunlia imazamoxiresistens TaxID=3127457 RepID=UPI00301AF049